MKTRRRSQSFTLEPLEGRLTLSSANAAFGQGVSDLVQALNAQPDHGDASLDFLGYKSRGQLISAAAQAYHQANG